MQLYQNRPERTHRLRCVVQGSRHVADAGEAKELYEGEKSPGSREVNRHQGDQVD